MKYDYLIVGAGFAGCVLAERIAEELDKKVLIVEKRNSVGGNCYDFPNEKGIIVHKYGPHAFHTNNEEVWNYLSRFTDWHDYQHKVLAFVQGKKIPIPFNLNSIDQFFAESKAEEYKKALVDTYGEDKRIPILKLKETENDTLKELADFVYKNVFYGYTIKQWGMPPEELDFSVTARVPVFTGRDDRYFHDKYQGIPAKGYTNLFKKIIDHKNIKLALNTTYRKVLGEVEFDKLIYTGPIDYFFDYMHGKLPYRSLRFQFNTLNKEYFQETAQINFPSFYHYTRITEFKHFLKKSNRFTTIAYEYPMEFEPNINEPYYPIPKEENRKIYEKYKEEAAKIEKNVTFIGRLAEYRYYNMDEIVAASLLAFKNKIANK